MPNYDYTCEECKRSFEIFQKITDASLTQCPECHKEGLRRGIGGGFATFRFMGDGFYITDYKKECSSPDSSCVCKKKSSSDA